MSDYLIGHIRTFVPFAIAAAATWLTDSFGIEIDGLTVEQLAIGLVGVLGGVYYAVVRGLAEKWPVVGVLLGVNKAPSYQE